MKHHLFENETNGDGADDGGTGEAPDWLLPKFKTPEDQARAYAEAEKEMQKLRAQADQERAQFAEALERIETVQQPAPPQQSGLDPQTQQLLSAYDQAVQAQDSAAMLSIQIALSQQATAQLLDDRFEKLAPRLDSQSQADRNIAFELGQERVAKQFGDQWDSIQPDVQAWLNEHQAWLPTVNDPAAFEKVVREGADIVLNERRAKELAAFESDRQAKLSTQTAQGSGSGKYPTATDDKKQAWAEVAGADIGSYGQMRGGS
jgi:hypothetical protein